LSVDRHHIARPIAALVLESSIVNVTFDVFPPLTLSPAKAGLSLRRSTSWVERTKKASPAIAPDPPSDHDGPGLATTQRVSSVITTTILPKDAGWSKLQLPLANCTYLARHCHNIVEQLEAATRHICVRY